MSYNFDRKYLNSHSRLYSDGRLNQVLRLALEIKYRTYVVELKKSIALNL